MTRRRSARLVAAEATSGGEGAGAGAGETFVFSGPDAGARFFLGFLLLCGGGAFPIHLWMVHRLGGWAAVGVFVLLSLALIAGLRAGIVVSPEEVAITRRWFFVPYRRYRAPCIDDVWYGGDWGEPEGALGVVVRLGKKEIHLGSPRSMHALYRALAARTRARTLPP